MIALVSPTDEITIITREAGAWRLEIPETTITVSPVFVGWEFGGWRVLDVTPFDPPDGKVTTGGPTYSLGDGVVVETYDVVDAPDPAAFTNENYGYARFGYVQGEGVIIKELSQKVGGVTRIAAGRYRVRDATNTCIELVVRSLLSRDPSTTPVHIHVFATTTTYVEVRAFKWNGTTFAAFDPSEIVVEFDKVVLQ